MDAATRQEIKELYIAGHEPRMIARIVGLPFWVVLGCLEDLSKNLQNMVDI